MLKIDGAMGEGGGQILRSSLALSLLTQTPITIERVRAGRSKPGLKKQHVTCVRAAAEVANARTKGAEVGSSQLVFRPAAISSGEYLFDIGSAGSTTLVLQTVLPALMLASGPSQVTLRGGTHNKGAPPFDFLQRSYLPRLMQQGPTVELTCQRHGFYPAGGGELRAKIRPVEELRGNQLLERGRHVATRTRALVSRLPEHIAERECDTIKRKTNWGRSSFEVVCVEDSPGPGNVVLIEMEFENVSAVFTGFGERGVRAEQVAKNALRAAETFWHSDVPVSEFLADQLLLPMGIAAAHGAASCFRTGPLSLHATTHIDVLKAFLEIKIETESDEEGTTVHLSK